MLCALIFKKCSSKNSKPISKNQSKSLVNPKLKKPNPQVFRTAEFKKFSKDQAVSFASCEKSSLVLLKWRQEVKPETKVTYRCECIFEYLKANNYPVIDYWSAFNDDEKLKKTIITELMDPTTQQTFKTCKHKKQKESNLSKPTGTK